jgi:hypothetical protein
MPNYDETGQPQPVHEVFGADGSETQLYVPGEASSNGDDVPHDGGDLRIGKFTVGYLEQHKRHDSRMVV